MWRSLVKYARGSSRASCSPKGLRHQPPALALGHRHDRGMASDTSARERLIEDENVEERRRVNSHPAGGAAPRLTAFLCTLTLAAGISGLLFGYEYETNAPV
jgi:hypothetical protein